MKISMILTIVGWVLFLLSIYFRSNHAEKRFGYQFEVRPVAFGLNLSALFCFLVSILFSLAFPNLNITV